jgi:glycyl-tRNA synthetase beta chain
MAEVRNLLVELLVEELPPKALKLLGSAFAAQLAGRLDEQGLFNMGVENLVSFATPRRLAVYLHDVRDDAEQDVVQTRLMPVAIGWDSGRRPTPALLKKLRALGHDESALEHIVPYPSGDLMLKTKPPNISLAKGLQTALDDALAKLPIPKLMSYQLEDGWSTVKFVRPAHALVALHGADVVPVSALGLQAGRTTHGHRFEAATDPIEIRDADSYAKQLRDEGAVIASFKERRAEIAQQLQVAADALGLKPIADDALLDEVTALVERPNVLTCAFDEAFLQVPPECLILTMKANQKYFPLLDAAGKLTNRFLVVSNIRPADPSRVIEGNERVVRPRLADARFFFDQDRKKTLASRVAGLDKVVYHGKLGSQGERVQRVRAIAAAIAAMLGGNRELAAQADRAAELAKADLLTDMVGEFPELQGVMGGYYARHDGEASTVAEAIEDHYRPRFAGDALPRGQAGIVVALADKLETLAGLFGIGQAPSGDKDPFALRRHALGVIRMLIERDLPLAVPQLVATAFTAFPPTDGPAPADLQHFLYDRLVGSLREQGYSAKEVDAVIALRPERWGEIPKRLAAVRAFAALPEAPPLAAANKRVGNILKKSDVQASAAIDPALLREDAESRLFEALGRIVPQADAAFEAGDYTASLQTLAALKTPVDAFFDGVMVNTDDPALRANRLALLGALHRAMNRVADLSRLAA